MPTEDTVMLLFTSVGGERYMRKFGQFWNPFVRISFLLFQLLELQNWNKSYREVINFMPVIYLTTWRSVGVYKFKSVYA